jgi:pilus assembly protein TadC
MRKRIDERLQALPKELRDPPVAFAAASFIGPLFIVLLALAAGQSDVSSPLYSVAAIVFVFAVGGFLLTSFMKLRVRRAEDERLEEERTRRRQTRRVSATSTNRSGMSEERRAS